MFGVRVQGGGCPCTRAGGEVPSTVVDGSWGGGCRWFSDVRLGVVEHVSDMPDGIDAACAHLLSCCADDVSVRGEIGMIGAGVCLFGDGVHRCSGGGACRCSGGGAYSDCICVWCC